METRATCGTSGVVDDTVVERLHDVIAGLRRLAESTPHVVPLVQAVEATVRGTPGASVELERVLRALTWTPDEPMDGSRKNQQRLAALREVGGDEFRPADLDVHDKAAAEVLDASEALVALSMGAVLPELAVPGAIVWDLGAAGVAFARALIGRCPGVTYVVSDTPDRLAAAAVALALARPEARLRFWPELPGTDGEWENGSCIFVPRDAIDRLMPPHVELVVSFDAFEAFHASDVEHHVMRAHALGAPYFYSFTRRLAREEASAIDRAFTRAYWPRELPLVSIAHRRLAERRRERGDPLTREEKADLRTWAGLHRHVIGWRRLVLG